MKSIKSFMVASVAAGSRIVPAKLRPQNLQCVVDLAILGDSGFSKVKAAARLRPNRGPGQGRPMAGRLALWTLSKDQRAAIAAAVEE